LNSVCKLISVAVALCVLTGCRPPLPPSKPLNELTALELRGRKVFVTDCARCHNANDRRALHGPGLQGLFKQKYLPTGAPANDDRVVNVVLHGHGLMPAFQNTMDEQQLDDLLAYLHTL
jgi:mono/diheme cytochrome c family protein